MVGHEEFCVNLIKVIKNRAKTIHIKYFINSSGYIIPDMTAYGNCGINYIKYCGIYITLIL
jgi:hypothetical protein